MKKFILLLATTIYGLAAFAQDSSSTPSGKTEGNTKPVVVDGQKQSQTSATDSIIGAEILKQLLEASAEKKEGGVKIVGYNVIIGNNNTIVVVADKKEAQHYLKNGSLSSDNDKLSRGFLERYSLALKSSTMGWGAELATSLSSNFTLRAGYNYMSYNTNKFNVEITDERFKQATSTQNYYPDLSTEGKFKQSHAHALVDFYPLRQGVFHITGGVYVGDTKMSVNAQLVDSKGVPAQLNPAETNWPQLGVNGRQLNIDPKGKLEGEFRTANRVKPYVGIGLGRAIPSNRFGIKFEVGMLYNGGYIIKQDGKEIAKSGDIKDSFEDIGNYNKYLKFWPVVNLQLIYRLK